MRKITITLSLLLLIFGVFLVFADVIGARTRARGYYKPRSGTYVQPYYRSSPNRSRLDNWGTKGNLNPYTGKKGTRNLWR